MVHDALGWWIAEAGVPARLPPLLGDVDADVVVVGGGYTGLWTALAVREREPSARVVVLEAERCGAGPSGRNGGFLHGYWASAADTIATLGREGALALARAGEAIIPAVRALGADVWLRDGGMLLVSTAPAQDAAVDAAVAAAEALGAPEQAVPLSADELAQRIRSPRFRRGVFFRDGATVQPARLVRALREAALARGVELFERGLICRADDRGDPVIQISPPLVADKAQFDELVGILGDVLQDAWARLHGAKRSDARHPRRAP